MKKLICSLLSLILIMAVTVPAFAATPKWEYHAPKTPEVKVSMKIPDKVFDDWFKAHPLNINIGFTENWTSK